MKLSEAHRTIDATAGFLRHLQSLENANFVEVEDDEEGLGVLAVQVYTTGTSPNPVRKCRFKYRSGDEIEFIVPQIAPVCDLLIDNWPSLSAKKLRSHIEETNVLYLANDILGLNDPMMYETGSEAYEYHSLLGGRPSLLLYEIYDINYRLAYALRMTEDEEPNKKQEYTVAKEKRNYAKEIDWVRATKNFNLNSIKDVVKTGRNKRERRSIIRAIRDAMIATGEMYKIPYSVDSLLMDLFKENGGSRKALLKAYDESNETLYIDDFIQYAIKEYMARHTATDADIDEIFAESPKSVESKDTEGEVSHVDNLSSSDKQIKTAVEIMKKEKVIKHLYDYAYIMKIMNETEDLPTFNSPKSFLDYFKDLGITDLPGEDSIKKKVNATFGSHPSWTFTDTKGKDANEAKRRNAVGSRFLSIYRKGK
jgi:hypothetical protein